MPSGACQAHDEASLYGIAGRHHDDGDRGGCTPGGIDRRVSGCHDHVNLELDELNGPSINRAWLSLTEAIIDAEVLPLDVAELSERAPCRLNVRSGEGRLASPQQPDARHLVGLRLDSRRRKQTRAGSDKHASPADHWITSSARSSSTAGLSCRGPSRS